jgi:transposase
LELKIQALSLHVLNKAVELASGKSTRPKVTKSDITAALMSVADEGRAHFENPKHDPPSQVANLHASLTPDAFHLLNGRMDVLRSYVLRFASDFAAPGANQQTLLLTTESIEAAWKAVWSNDTLRSTALTRGEEFFSGKVAS